MTTLALTNHAGIRLAELGLLLTAAAGVAIALTALAPPSGKKFWTLVGGGALALAGILLIVAVHWGHFG